METKEDLVKAIKEWVRIDNELRTLQKEQTQRKIDKKNISAKLMEIMKKNAIDSFDINDGEIMYNKKSVKKAITKKVLMDVLSKYYKDDQTKANELNNFIMNNREEIVKETIVRKIRKPEVNP